MLTYWSMALAVSFPLKVGGRSKVGNGQVRVRVHQLPRPDTVALVRDYITGNPDVYSNTSKFIEGWGWDHTSWPVQEWPTAVRIIPRSWHR
jgi:hypothetical protein